MSLAFTTGSADESMLEMSAATASASLDNVDIGIVVAAAAAAVAPMAAAVTLARADAFANPSIAEWCQPEDMRDSRGEAAGGAMGKSLLKGR